MPKELNLKPPPNNLGDNLGLAQQCWHMANAVCDALGMDFGETSPAEIHEQITAAFAERLNAEWLNARLLVSKLAGERAAMNETARALRERAGVAFAAGQDEYARNLRELATEWDGRVAAAGRELDAANSAMAEFDFLR